MAEYKNTKLKRHRKTGKKILALFLVLTMIFSTNSFTMSLDSILAYYEDNQEIIYPVIKYMGENISDDMNIPKEAELTAYYEFETSMDDDVLILLPEPLIATGDGNVKVAVNDIFEGWQDAGTATVSTNGAIKLDLYNMNQSDDESQNNDFDQLDDILNIDEEDSSSQYSEENASQDEENSSNQDEEDPIYEDEEVIEEPDVKEEDSDIEEDSDAEGDFPVAMFNTRETFLVSFEVPCIIDLDQVEDSIADGVLQVTLLSDGQEVKVNLTSFEPSSMMMLYGVEEYFHEFVTVGDCDLYLDDDKIENGTLVSYDDTMIMRYTFEITEEQFTYIEKNKLNVPIPIYLPEGLQWPIDDFAKILSIDYEDGSLSEEFAVLSLDEEGRGCITFGGIFWENGASNLKDGYLELECILDEADTDGEYDFSIMMLKEKMINICIKENKLKDAEITKTGVFNDNRINWEITYTPGEIESSTLTILDEFNNEDHIFVWGSLKLIIDGKERTNEVIEEEMVITKEDSPTTKISYIIDDKENDKSTITIKYQTRLADGKLDGMSSTEDLEINNTVSLMSGTTPIVGPKTTPVKVAAEHRRWLHKAGKQDGREIEWTIEISSLDRDLKNLVMYDAIPEGLTLIPGSVKVNNQLPENVDADFTEYKVNDDNPYDSDDKSIYTGWKKGTSFTLAFDSTQYTSKYIVTYKTRISDEYFDSPGLNNKDFDNEAWITFDWMYYEGNGEGTGTYTRITPIIGKSPYGAITNVIQKTALGYDRSTHKITWRVDVNPYGVNIKSGVITDDLESNDQKYVGGSFQAFGENASKLTLNLGENTDDIDKDILTISVGELGIESSYFTFETYVVNEEADYASNLPEEGKEYENIVEFVGLLNVIDSDPVEITDRSKAEVLIESQMIEKKGIDYSYNEEGEIEVLWEIVFNQNKMPMVAPVITDVIPDGQAYVADTVNIINQSYKDAFDVDISKVDGKNTLIIKALETDESTDEITIEDTIYIQYKTKVNPNYDDQFKNSSEGNSTEGSVVEIENSATLVHGSYSPVSHTGIQKISNEILNKEGKRDPNDGKIISYRVEINPNGVDIAGEKLIDQLPKDQSKELRLDITSVLLVEATMDDNKTFQVADGGNTWEYTDDVFDFSKLTSNSEFSITLPDDNEGEHPGRYILTYDCVIVKGTVFSNKISFANIDGGVSGNNENEVNVGGSGGGTSSKKSRLTITKQDSMREGVKLEGVTFKVYQKINSYEILIMEVTTDEKGKAELYPLSVGAEYFIVESKTKEGYKVNSLSGEKIDNENIEITVSDTRIDVKIKKFGSYEHVVKNTPQVGSFDFIKCSNKDNENEFVPLTEEETAGFTITDQTETDGSRFEITEFNDKDGKVSFTNVPFGTYIVSETTKPEYHTKHVNFEVEIGTDGALVKAPPENVENVYYRPSLTITKEDANGNPLSGIEFELYENGSVKGEPEQTDSYGKVTFTELLGGNSYTVKEKTNSQTGYYKTGEYVIKEVEQASNYTKTWINYPKAAKLEITKVDELRPGVVLQGAEFELYSDNKGVIGSKISDEIITDANGIATFSGLELIQDLTKLSIDSEPVLLPTSYWIIEVKAPKGYDLNPEPFKVTLDPTATDVTEPSSHTYKQTVTNTPAEHKDTSITFRKISNKDNQPLEGVEFTIIDKTQGSTYTDKKSSGSDGTVTFTGIPFGMYKVVETKAAQYHTKMADFYFTINENGICTEFNGKPNPAIGTSDFDVINEILNVNLNITKINADNTSEEINGIVFNIYNSNDLENSIDSQTSGPTDGKVVFNNLLGGDSYVVKETTSPQGYYLSRDYTTETIEIENERIEIDDERIEIDGEIKLLWMNYPYAASIIIEKVDKDRPEIKLNGATFALYNNVIDARNQENAIDTQSTANGGIATFTNLPLTQNTTDSSWLWNTEPVLSPTTYWLVETTSPNGYETNDTSIEPIEITLTTRTQNYKCIVANQAKKGDLIFKKLSADSGEGLAGVEFKLTYEGVVDEAAVTCEYSRATSNNEGMVNFQGVPFGTYTLSEESTPSPYMPIDPIVIKISQDGKCTQFGDMNDVSEPSNLSVINEVSDAFVQITSVDNLDNPMVGVRFTFYRKVDNDWIKVEEKITLDDGKVTFEAIYPGADYKIVEDTPLGYYKLKPYEFTALDDENLLTWVYHPIVGEIKIIKTDSLRDIPVAGACFQLFKKSNDNNHEFIEKKSTDNKGELVFGDILLNFTPIVVPIDEETAGRNDLTLIDTEYIIKEFTPADGYLLDQDNPNHIVKLRVKEELGKKDQSGELTLTNAPVTGEVEFTKVNEWGIPLSGAKFKLIDQTIGSSYKLTATSEEGEDEGEEKGKGKGRVIFTNIPFGVYKLKETKAPAGHNKNTTEYIIEIGICGNLIKTEAGNKVVNNFHSASITITAIDDSTDKQPIEGIVYEVYGEDGEKRGEGTTDENGRLIIPNLMVGIDYTVKKVISTGYYSSESFTVPALSEDYNITWINHPMEGKIKITKTDSVRGLLLSGVNFGLYQSDGNTLVESVYTDEDGIATFNKIPLNYSLTTTTDLFDTITLDPKTYIIKEIAPKDGYKSDDEEYEIELTEDKPYQKLALSNAPITADVEFIKVNEWDMPLSGAEFKIVDQTTGSNYTDTATSDEVEGKVIFKDVPFGSYILTETKAPDNHYLDTTEYPIEIGTNGTLVQTVDKVINNFHDASVTITKLDDKTGAPIEGAVYEIYDSAGTKRGTAATSQTGKVIFTGMMVGMEYTIEEVSTPIGYYSSKPYEIAELTKDDHEVTWIGYPGEGTITITAVSTSNNNTKIEGIKFGIYAQSNPDVLLAEAITDSSGKITFINLLLVTEELATNNLPPVLSQNEVFGYVIKEIENIEGYSPITTSLNINLSYDKLNIIEELEKEPIVDNNLPGGGSQPGGGNQPGGGTQPGGGNQPGGGTQPGGGDENQPKESEDESQSNEEDPDNQLDKDYLKEEEFDELQEEDSDDDDDKKKDKPDDQSSKDDIIGNGSKEEELEKQPKDKSDKGSQKEGSGSQNNYAGDDKQPILKTLTEAEIKNLIPDITTISEEKVMYLTQLSDGYSIVEIENNYYIVYDKNGASIGYFQLPQGTSLEEYDIMSNIKLFDKDNPSTGDRTEPTENRMWKMIWPFVLIIGLLGIAFIVIRKKKIKL